jgi:biotin transport system substrate-specific component
MSSSALAPSRRAVLVDLLPASLGRDVALVAAGVLLTALAAQLVVPLPFTPVPITGTTFAVLLLGAAYGPARGAASLGAYLLIGMLGVPVFAEFSGGVSVVLGATGGYLIAFPIAALVVGALARRGWDRSVAGTAAAFALGSLLIYAIGVPWLAIVAGMDLRTALGAGALPFLLGDVVKAVLAGVALPLAWKATRTDREAG